MGVVNPLTREQASPELQDTFEKLAARAGKVPNIFAAMAHRPAVLNTFLPLYKAVVNEGTVEAKYKELAYLRTSMVNGCEYCTRAHSASSKGAGVTAEQVARCRFIHAASFSMRKKKPPSSTPTA
jgi:AhpD family alkylhydroperoxidase